MYSIIERWKSSVIRQLLKYEVLFDGTLGDWKTSQVQFELKEGMEPYHGKPFPVPQILMDMLKQEVLRLVELRVLVRQPESK